MNTSVLNTRRELSDIESHQVGGGNIWQFWLGHPNNTESDTAMMVFAPTTGVFPAILVVRSGQTCFADGGSPPMPGMLES
jgi:hypothetical protein